MCKKSISQIAHKKYTYSLPSKSYKSSTLQFNMRASFKAFNKDGILCPLIHLDKTIGLTPSLFATSFLDSLLFAIQTFILLSICITYISIPQSNLIILYIFNLIYKSIRYIFYLTGYTITTSEYTKAHRNAYATLRYRGIAISKSPVHSSVSLLPSLYDREMFTCPDTLKYY